MMSENTIVFNKDLFMTTYPPFDGECFSLWKARMNIFIEENDIDTRVTIKNGMFIPTYYINNKVVNRANFLWTGED